MFLQPTHKLHLSNLPPDARVQIAGGPRQLGSDELSWLSCSTNSGPWQGQLSSEFGCIGTCSPIDTLILLNTPNEVEWTWSGSIENHQPGFEFATAPKLMEKDDLGSCYVPKSK
jgi:hypothetical protein